MAKIGGLPNFNYREKSGEKIKRDSTINPSKNFIDFFNRRVEKSSNIDDKNSSDFDKKQLDDIRKKISELGKNLVDERTEESIREYKNEIKKFIKYITTSAYLNKKVKARKKNIMEHDNFYIIIDVIDKKLEQLSIAILEEQRKPISILKKIDEIDGLIIDLLS